MAGSDKMWADLIPSHAKRKQVLDLRKELRLPIEFRQMKPQDALPLEPELYIAELQKVEVALRAGEAENREKAMYNYEELEKKNIVHTVGSADAIKQLDNRFEKLLISDLILFHEKYPQHKSIGLSSTYRGVDKQAGILSQKLFEFDTAGANSLKKLYGGNPKRKPLFDALAALAYQKSVQPKTPSRPIKVLASYIQKMDIGYKKVDAEPQYMSEKEMSALCGAPTL